jgi:hypothetical protein
MFKQIAAGLVATGLFMSGSVGVSAEVLQSTTGAQQEKVIVNGLEVKMFKGDTTKSTEQAYVDFGEWLALDIKQHVKGTNFYWTITDNTGKVVRQGTGDYNGRVGAVAGKAYTLTLHSSGDVEATGILAVRYGH